MTLLGAGLALFGCVYNLTQSMGSPCRRAPAPAVVLHRIVDDRKAIALVVVRGDHVIKALPIQAQHPMRAPAPASGKSKDLECCARGQQAQLGSLQVDMRSAAYGACMPCCIRRCKLEMTTRS